MINQSLTTSAVLLRAVLLNSKFEVNTVDACFVANGELAHLMREATSALPDDIKSMWLPENVWSDEIGQQKLQSFLAKLKAATFPSTYHEKGSAEENPRISLDEILYPIKASLLEPAQRSSFEQWLDSVPNLDFHCDHVGLVARLVQAYPQDFTARLQVIISSISNLLYSTDIFASPALCFNPILDELIHWLTQMGSLDGDEARSETERLVRYVPSDEELATRIREKMDFYPEYLFVPSFDENFRNLVLAQTYPFRLSEPCVDELCQHASDLYQKYS